MLWVETLKTAAYILNSAPRKAVSPFDLLTGRKLSLPYFNVWGCPSVAKIYGSSKMKIDQ